MVDWLQHINLPFRLVLTKADKLSRNKQQKQVNAIADSLGVPKGILTPTSAETGLGVKDLWREIQTAYENDKHFAGPAPSQDS
jgi:GTP-binding protein